MRFLQINIAVNSGSHGRIAEEIGIAVMAAGHRSYIAAAYTDRPSKSEVIKIGNNLDRKQHGLKSRVFDRHGFGSKRSTKAFIKQIEQVDPDLIHLHNIHGYYINVRFLFEYLKKIQKPIVWTFHDCWPFTGHCSYFDRMDCFKWQTVCYKCPLKKYYPASWLVDNSRKNFIDKKKLFTGLKNLVIVSPSEWLADHIKNSFLSEYQIEVINNGIDTEKFKPGDQSEIKRKYGLRKKYILGVADRWTSRKGLNDFILLSKILGDDTDIVLVGFKAQQIKHLPLKIIGIERTESIEELSVLYSGAEAFINPTYVDNFPSVNLEALACGTPVITYNTGGSPEAIDEKTGFIVPKGDIRAVALLINKITDVERNKYVIQCRQRATSLYDCRNMVRQYLILYQSLIEN